MAGRVCFIKFFHKYQKKERKMKAKYGVVVMAIGMGLCLYSYGNDSFVEGVGGGMMQIIGHPSVVMESAIINIRLATAEVECNYVMYNTGDAVDVTIGFPERAHIGSGFKDFKSYIDGDEVEVKPLPAHEGESGFSRFWVKEVHFEAGQRRNIRNTYIGGLGGSVGGKQWFTYDVDTAACWKGKIGYLKITVDLSNMNSDFRLTDIDPRNYELGNNKIVWRWEDVEPTSNINLYFYPYYMRLYVDNAQCFLGLGPSGGDYTSELFPSRASGVLTVGLSNMARMLELKNTISESGGKIQSTLVGQGKTASFEQDSDYFSIDGKRKKLGMSLYRECDDLVVPLIPIAEAFGYLVRYKEDSDETRLYSPEAQAEAAIVPDWISRELNEEELSDKKDWELVDMRNEIYARHGCINYPFDNMPWYKPNLDYTDAMLSDTERNNITLLEKSLKDRETAKNIELEKQKREQSQSREQTKKELTAAVTQPSNPKPQITSKWSSHLIKALKQWWREESENEGEITDNPLMTFIESGPDGLRYQAACLLGLLGDPRAIPHITEYLKSDTIFHPGVLECIDALMATKDPSVIEPIRFCLRDPDADNRKYAIEALRTLGYEPTTEEEKIELLVAERKWDEVKAKGIAAIIPLLCLFDDRYDFSDYDYVVRKIAEMGDAATEPLNAALTHEDPKIQKAVAYVIESLGHNSQDTDSLPVKQ
jgi:hypothetical protein